MTGPGLEDLPETLDAGPFNLRRYTAADAPAVRAGLQDELLQTWWDLRLADDDAARTWCTTVREDRVRWAVTQGDELLGTVQLTHLDLVDASCQLGWWLLPQGRGRGAAATAVRAVAEAARKLGVVQVVAFHAVENEASCRVAERAGLPWEATHRLSRFPDGLLHDEHCHASVVPIP